VAVVAEYEQRIAGAVIAQLVPRYKEGPWGMEALNSDVRAARIVGTSTSGIQDGQCPKRFGDVRSGLPDLVSAASRPATERDNDAIGATDASYSLPARRPNRVAGQFHKVRVPGANERTKAGGSVSLCSDYASPPPRTSPSRGPFRSTSALVPCVVEYRM
jgi:hypothetical protein